MIGRIRGSEVFKEVKLHFSRHWLRILIALALALSIGSAGQSPPVQAAPDNPADVYFEVGAYPDDPPPLCINQNLQIYVSVSRGIVKTINDQKLSLPRGSVTGVDVRGLMTNNIGKLTPPDTSPVQLIDFRQGNADFLFTASKVGTTTLIFNADVPGAWTGSAEALALGKTYPARKAEIKIEVRNCKFKVITASHWSASAPNLTSNLVANLQDVMEVNANGQYAGTAEVTWSAASYSYMCSHEHTIPPGQAHLTGDLTDNGVLRVHVTYDPVTLASVNCDGAESDTLQIQGPPIEIAVNASGGTLTQAQTLQVGIMSFSGSTTIVVIPEEGEAVAFNTDSRAALSPSAWRAMLWDNFPWPHNASLALR